jgi:hypothetical protein
VRDPLSPEDLRRNFERELSSVMAGGGLTTGRAAFEAQLDGRHAAARMADLRRRIQESNRRWASLTGS